jgi:serine/threonine protein kinase/formylglycine-generating enzyme required for sulfatase activity/dienelactone hydrolase
MMRLGRYTIHEPLGSGGMGIVYRAHDEALDRVVAIKVLPPGTLSDENARYRFRKEALALAKLSHPHVATVYDVGHEGDTDYIVMECVAGESLAQRLKSGPLSVREATSIVIQIGQALEEAHERGVVHRDLKPSNVMITPKGQVKVLDFGLAKIVSANDPDATRSVMETQGAVGTPLYMSPEQARGDDIDPRTDLWSLGVIYFELLTKQLPFPAGTSLSALRAILDEAPLHLRRLRPDAPAQAEEIITKALEKNPETRYQSASEMVADASDLLSRLSTSMDVQRERRKHTRRLAYVLAAIAVVAGVSLWAYIRSSRRQWAREEAIPQMRQLLDGRRPLAGFLLLKKAEGYLPGDPELRQIAETNTQRISIDSTPAGATVEIQDYTTPDAPWTRLGTTPIEDLRMPKGYFRWKISKAGVGEMVEAPLTEATMEFPLSAANNVPSGMVYVPPARWTEAIGFIGWLGPYDLPGYFVDRYEVTNREYQKFVDSGGYVKKEYWPASFAEDGRAASWEETMRRFRDSTGRPGPATWVGGHYPEGQGEFPVAGVSWFEAAAYAAFAGKSLPTVAQWFQTAPADVAGYTVRASNISSGALAPVGAYKGLGPYGTYDMAGNVREWAANTIDDHLRLILGGSWRSPDYLYFDPEALTPFDRSDTNGFRCVRNTTPLPEAATLPIRRAMRDFAGFKPAPDSVFRAYELLYAYPKSPLNARVEGVVKETADWREEKVTIDAAYDGERMPVYLFLPKNVKPPYQTVLFFPSARVLFLPDSGNGTKLGDVKFFDYIIQSGRAVVYPVYQNTYERRVKFYLPDASQNIQLTSDWYKDAARSLDYLATRSDIDSGKLAYLGVSMGSADGVILSTLLQDRLKAVVYLDGGYFLDTPPRGGDQADFAPRMKRPVLMVNGRYDFTFPVAKAQDPLFKMLGTAEGDKRHIVLDTPHDVTEQRPLLVKAVLDWLDRYLGPVQ